jgi:methionine synthase II (cobalamin-independent)
VTAAQKGPPFRAAHECSLPAAGFKAVQDEAVRGAIAMQEEAGLQAITDGEFHRPSYWARFVERVWVDAA